LLNCRCQNQQQSDVRMRPSYWFLLMFPILFTPVTCAQEVPRSGNPKPIETSVCKILANPSAFNNKLVKVRGYVSVSFEYSTLQNENCSGALWFALGDGSGPPGLGAVVNGNGKPGRNQSTHGPAELIHVKLIRDSKFQKFEHYLAVKAEARPCRNDLTRPTPPDCAVDRVSATFIGRIDSVSKKTHAAHLTKSPFDHPDFKGFGQMGMFDAELVLQSVDDVVAVDSIGRPKP
jgi:hypothetical protein